MNIKLKIIDKSDIKINDLCYEYITILNKSVYRTVVDAEKGTTFYEYEYLSNCDGKLRIIFEDDLHALFFCYEVIE